MKLLLLIGYCLLLAFLSACSMHDHDCAIHQQEIKDFEVCAGSLVCKLTSAEYRRYKVVTAISEAEGCAKWSY
jgi:tRNA U54 and U55 pseudouridine synthase Pus10